MNRVIVLLHAEEKHRVDFARLDEVIDRRTQIVRQRGIAQYELTCILEIRAAIVAMQIAPLVQLQIGLILAEHVQKMELIRIVYANQFFQQPLGVSSNASVF